MYAVRLLVAALAGLAAAFVVAPGPLARLVSAGGPRGEADVVAVLVPAFEDYWRTGARALTPALDSLASYWSLFHVVKALCAGLLLVAVLALARRAWRGSRPHLALLVAGVGGLGPLLLVMANVQGALAPVSSLFSMLPVTSPDPGPQGTVTELRAALLARGRSGAVGPAPLEVLLEDFARYHWIVAVLSLLAALAVLAGAVVSTRHTRSRRWVWRGAAAVLASGFLVLAVANTTNALDPARGLLGYVGT